MLVLLKKKNKFNTLYLTSFVCVFLYQLFRFFTLTPPLDEAVIRTHSTDHQFNLIFYLVLILIIISFFILLIYLPTLLIIKVHISVSLLKIPLLITINQESTANKDFSFSIRKKVYKYYCVFRC
ncbi:hypothetical protein HLPCO_001729 [Haloplasma contractile SSD-17B]|uniref:Uncharacterized protein n=1 Tax=Haloplasma contractile SSD-17B TaxID=1033810 RepID=U2DUX1_9MOLU|nr:hypothetical protein HLPCO_001729 [Haloplasma contractile SSD-17B]